MSSTGSQHIGFVLVDSVLPLVPIFSVFLMDAIYSASSQDAAIGPIERSPGEREQRGRSDYVAFATSPVPRKLPAAR